MIDFMFLIALMISLHLDGHHFMNHGDIFGISCRMFWTIVNAFLLQRSS